MAQVYAPTIPGFGRSEKPALAYSQTLWLDFLREFVVEVVRWPVVVVGNSIGGFICASLAAAAPRIVKGAPPCCPVVRAWLQAWPARSLKQISDAVCHASAINVSNC